MSNSNMLNSQNMTLVCLLFMVCCPSFYKMVCSCRKIRPCPSINPGCVSTNPKSSSFAFPLRIPENSSDNAIQVLKLYVFTLRHFKLNVAWYETLVGWKSFDNNFFLHFELNWACISWNFLCSKPFCRNCKKQSWKHRKTQKFRLWKIHQMVSTRLSSTVSLVHNKFMTFELKA